MFLSCRFIKSVSVILANTSNENKVRYDPTFLHRACVQWNEHLLSTFERVWRSALQTAFSKSSITLSTLGWVKALPLDVIAESAAVSELSLSSLAGTLHNLKHQCLVSLLKWMRCWSLDGGFVNGCLGWRFINCWSDGGFSIGLFNGQNGPRLCKLIKRVYWRVKLFTLKDVCWQDDNKQHHFLYGICNDDI